MPPQQKVRHSMKLIVLARALKYGKIIQCTKQLGILCTYSSAIYRMSLLCP
jgi:hypothetical protein